MHIVSLFFFSNPTKRSVHEWLLKGNASIEVKQVVTIVAKCDLN
jgi:hypothetical protein